MHKHFLKFLSMCLVVTIIMALSGCTLIFQKGRRSDVEKISQLKSQLSDLERAKAELETRLKSEIDDKEVKVDMLDRGLVITFVSEVLFSSGKADLRPESLSKLQKVASVLKTTVSDLNVGIEGHTDNVPIKVSGWKSNWELSTARALSVLHHLEDKEGIDPTRLSATGYGEFRPVASNATNEGKQKNRRVEIVILPKTMAQGREE
ncbi:MAG: OmpA family protein [Candidatus Omnitrophica bacterium]|nr:OmpA family protein [Candidatus Omnitrophota bacterium]